MSHFFFIFKNIIDFFVQNPDIFSHLLIFISLFYFLLYLFDIELELHDLPMDIYEIIEENSQTDKECK